MDPMKSFSRSTKHIYASLLYSIKFPVICLITKIVSVHDLPDLNPYCLSSTNIMSFMLFVMSFLVSFRTDIIHLVKTVC